MAKIGRNDPCPCGSGLKYKKCCLGKAGNQIMAAAEKNKETSLREKVVNLQEKAVARQSSFYTLGAFILFTTVTGDGWVLEITEMDAVQVAGNGEKLDVIIEESAETIEINWTYHFTLKDKKFVAKSYANNEITSWEGYPIHSIVSAIKKIRKTFSPEQLKSIYHDENDLEVDHDR